MNRLVRVTVLERRWFRWREITYVGRFRLGSLTGEWSFWGAEDGVAVDSVTAQRLGNMALSASAYDRMMA